MTSHAGQHLENKFPISEATKRRNPHLFGPMGAVEAGQPESVVKPALARSSSQQQGRSGIMVAVTLLALRRRLLDSDNNVGSCKPLRDAVALSLGFDDGDPRITWEYGQVITRGCEGCVVKIELKDTQ